MTVLARRMLAMIDNKTTDLAPSSHREPVEAHTSPEPSGKNARGSDEPAIRHFHRLFSEQAEMA